MHISEDPIDRPQLDRQVEQETLPFLRESDIAMMCYSPLAGGVLSGKYEPGEPPPEGSRAEQSKAVRQMLGDEEVQAILKRLETLAEENDLPLNPLAVLWLIENSSVTSVILGGHKSEHFAESYDVADRSLGQDVVACINELSAPRVYTTFRNQPVDEGPALAEQW